MTTDLTTSTKHLYGTYTQTISSNDNKCALLLTQYGGHNSVVWSEGLVDVINKFIKQ